MSNRETCEIKLVEIRHEKDGFFSYTPGISRWEAHKMTPSGLTTIFESEEFASGTYGFFERYNDRKRKEAIEKEEAEYERMIAYLIGEGWEPVATDNPGRRISIMKRSIVRTRGQTEESPSTHATTNPTDMLEQLANLRAAGILTEQEFQTKKAEILKRI